MNIDAILAPNQYTAMRYTILFLLLFKATSFLQAQEINLAISEIPKELLSNANSVVRLQERVVSIPDRNSLEIEEKRIVTVLNKKGNGAVNAYVHYDDVTRIASLKAVIYNKWGQEVKSYKKKDFKDVAAVDGFSLFSDSRVFYLDHTPTGYPYTISFTFKSVSKNTAFIPSFYATSDYDSSTEKARVKLVVNEELGFRYKKTANDESIKIEENLDGYVFSVQDVKAISSEPFGPGFENIVAKARFALDYFHLEGVDGTARSWKDFGKWMDDYLLAGTRDIDGSTATAIKSLVAPLQTTPEKVQAVYEYMQERTRYISVQVGIGGWKPKMASEVDALGYGDCKALSNYTKSLLEVAGVPSYYTVLYGGSSKRNIDKEFPALQGNHATLAVPHEDDYIWLECTSQEVPTGFIAGFTDDRDVLIITPEGGEIVHTKKYDEKANKQEIKGDYRISPDGMITANLVMISTGTQYDDSYQVEKYKDDEKKDHYYDFWDYVNNLDIQSIEIVNDKNEASLKETIAFKADKYATKAGNDMLINLNALNRFRLAPKRLTNRKYDIVVDRGFYDTDEVTITLPDGYTLGVMPEDTTITSTYGEYRVKVEKISDKELAYNRSFLLREGTYPKTDYRAFRDFLKTVVKNDKQKIILTNN